MSIIVWKFIKFFHKRAVLDIVQELNKNCTILDKKDISDQIDVPVDIAVLWCSPTQLRKEFKDFEERPEVW